MKLLFRFSIFYVVLISLVSSTPDQYVSLRSGKKQYEKSNYSQALKHLMVAWEKDSSDIDNLRMIVECNERLRDYKNEIILRTKLSNMDNKDSHNELRLGVLTCRDKGFDAALFHFIKYNNLVGDSLQIDIVKIKKRYLDSKDILYGYRVDNIEGNSKGDDVSPSYIPNSKRVAFSSNRENNNYKSLVHKVNGNLTHDLYIGDIDSIKIANVDIYLEQERTKYHEGDVSFYPSGKKAYITANVVTKRDKEIPLSIKEIFLDLDSDDNPNSGKKEQLSFVNKEYNYGHITFSPNGNYALFVSDMPGGYGGTDIWYVDYDGYSFGTPINCGDIVNTQFDETSPFISSDSTIYLGSSRLGGLGGLDIYKTSIIDIDGKSIQFSEPINMGSSVNSKFDDIDFIWSDDKKSGIFSSNRPGGVGGYDLYNVFFREEELKDDTNAIEEVRAVITHYDLENIYFDFDRYNLRDESKSRLANLVNILKEYPEIKIDLIGHTDSRGPDTYNMKLSEQRSKVAYQYLVSEGISEDRLTYKGMGESSPVNVCTSCTIKDHQANRRTEFHIIDSTIPKEVDIPTVGLFNVDYSRSNDQSESLNNIDNNLSRDVESIFLDKIDYSFDSRDLNKEAKVKLDRLIEILNTHSSIKIDLVGHTDSRGDRNYNIILSRRRAKSAYDYLVKQGISDSRLTFSGKGEEDPIIDCSDGLCNNFDHSINRRTEFLIVAETVPDNFNVEEPLVNRSKFSQITPFIDSCLVDIFAGQYLK